MDKQRTQEKRELRTIALATRHTVQERERKSVRICERLAQLPVLQGVRSVMVFSAMNEEIDLWPWVEERLSEGVVVAYPVCLTDSKEIQPRTIKRREELIPGTWGILEPGQQAPIVAPEALDAVIVPGLTFDRKGYRIGYGAGYYDRFLPRLHADAVTVGTVYGELLVDCLPKEPHDIAVDWLVTQVEAFQTERRAQ